MPWNEIEIERLIKSNRNFLDKEIGRKYELPSLFINPTEQNLVGRCRFTFLNLYFVIVRALQ